MTRLDAWTIRLGVALIATTVALVAWGLWLWNEGER